MSTVTADWAELFIRPNPTQRAETEWGEADGLTLAEVYERLHPVWHRYAACNGRTADMYPEGRGVHGAKKLCVTCPVLAECSEAGMVEKYGIWGGMAERRRNKDRRARQKETSA